MADVGILRVSSLWIPHVRASDVTVEEVSLRSWLLWPVTIHLTAEAFPDRLENHSAQAFQWKNRKNPLLQPLRLACERPKRTLSCATQTIIEVGYHFEPLAVKLASDFFNGTETTNADNAVAYGSLPSRRRSALLGIETPGPPSLKRNIAVPTKNSEIFSIYSDNQPGVIFAIDTNGILDVSIYVSDGTTSKRNPPTTRDGGSARWHETFFDDLGALAADHNALGSFAKFVTASKLKLNGAVNDTIKRLNLLKEDHAEACIGLVSFRQAYMFTA
ncbi:hypothetical protein B0H19DRAFT_1257591 [Mycena capillaripes]|nr:hypothetical protein B0H19DRAFT_1257591 [Mycena capillaripes]